MARRLLILGYIALLLAIILTMVPVGPVFASYCPLDEYIAERCGQSDLTHSVTLTTDSDPPSSLLLNKKRYVLIQSCRRTIVGVTRVQKLSWSDRDFGEPSRAGPASALTATRGR